MPPELGTEEATALQPQDQLEITKLMLVPPPAHGKETFTLMDTEIQVEAGALMRLQQQHHPLNISCE